MEGQHYVVYEPRKSRNVPILPQLTDEGARRYTVTVDDAQAETLLIELLKTFQMPPRDSKFTNIVVQTYKAAPLRESQAAYVQYKTLPTPPVYTFTVGPEQLESLDAFLNENAGKFKSKWTLLAELEA